MRLPDGLSSLVQRFAPWYLPVAAFASMVELIGGGWDIQWHLARVPEVFWTPPHIVLYSGAAVVLASLGGAFLLRWTDAALPRSVRVATTVAFAGILLQFVAGGFDNAWHAAFGADDSLSPPHVLLTGSMVVTAVGLVVALHAWRRAEGTTDRSGISWMSHAVAVTTLAWASWGFLFILLFPGLTVQDRLIESFGLRLFTGALFAGLLPLMVLAAAGLVRHRGAATVSALTQVVGFHTIAGLMGTLTPLNVAFSVLFVLPGLAADFLYRPNRPRSTVVALAFGVGLGQYGFITGGVVEEMTAPGLASVPFALAFAVGGALLAWLAVFLRDAAEGLAAHDRALVVTTA